MHQRPPHWEAHAVLSQRWNKFNLAFQKEIPVDLSLPEFLSHQTALGTRSSAPSQHLFTWESPGRHSISPLPCNKGQVRPWPHILMAS